MSPTHSKLQTCQYRSLCLKLLNRSVVIPQVVTIVQPACNISQNMGDRAIAHAVTGEVGMRAGVVCEDSQFHGSYANTGTELTLGDLVSCLQDFKIGAVFKKEQHSEPAKHEKILC